ncbi:hypothetical protein ASL14_22250 [Paenibacillus sp. IHB B 3084]|nr:hypothetical protein ASL14_22250 [Paenibacillus sp. IHB B 3084]
MQLTTRDGIFPSFCYNPKLRRGNALKYLVLIIPQPQKITQSSSFILIQSTIHEIKKRKLLLPQG